MALNERAELCRELSEAARAQGQDCAVYEAASAEALDRAKVIKNLLESEWTEMARGHAQETRGFAIGPRP